MVMMKQDAASLAALGGGIFVPPKPALQGKEGLAPLLNTPVGGEGEGNYYYCY